MALSPASDPLAAQFVLDHAARSPVPLVPEISLRTATEVTPLWQATEAWLEQRGVPPPFWAFPWVGGQALARWLLDHPGQVRGKQVIDFATGSGLVAIAARMAGAARVQAVDIDRFACAACLENAREQGVEIDVLRQDLVGQPTPGCDLLLAGDIFYDQADARAFLPWLREVKASGVRVLVGDPGRAYAPAEGFVELARFEVPTHPDLEGQPRRGARVLELLG